MKKKVWDITVVDNPNRAVANEQDTFYTTDTEAFLIFRLTDQEFKPTKALLSLNNRNDGSVVSEDVSVSDEGVIAWEMRENVIAHPGQWQGQLVYEQEKNGKPEKYTSSEVSFSVAGHLLDSKEPTLVEIQNWEKFIADASGLMDGWGDLEALRQANERQRQENYQELLDTGVLQTNINEKLGDLEGQYAPKLTEVTAQLAQNNSQLAQTKQEAERKRELEDLSPEVISAIEGGEGTSFDLLSIPQDKSVTYEKLDEKYRYKETPSGIDLNSLTKDGNYYAVSPLNSPNNLSGVVDVSNFNAIVMQKFTQHNDPSQVWNRRIFRGEPESWIKEQITEVDNIPRTRLAVDYNAYTSPPTMGSGTNLNTLVSEGYYFIVAGATNIPPRFTESFFLEVKRVSANFVIQKAYQLSYPERIMIRQVGLQNLEGQYKWVNISQSSQATRNWIALGDSITGTAFRYFYRTRDLLQVNGANAGVGGSSMASRPDTKYELYEADAFVNKTANLDFSTQNIVTVFFGTNDFGASVPLGAIDSIDPETFNGAINVGLENIYASNPKIDLMFITPIWRNGWDVPNEKGLTLKDYVDAIIDFCDRNHIACYDAFRKSGINKFNQSTFLSDGLHPNELGGDKLGSCIASAVKSLI